MIAQNLTDHVIDSAGPGMDKYGRYFIRVYGMQKNDEHVEGRMHRAWRIVLPTSHVPLFGLVMQKPSVR